jgi:hypothetical protein
MHRVCNQNRLPRLLMIVFSIMMVSAMAVANEGPAVQVEPVPEDSRPGPLGIAVSGGSAGITTDYFEQTITEEITASGTFSSIANSEAAKIVMRMIRADGVFPDFEEAKKAPYFLQVRIIKVNTPTFSMRMTVDIDVIWSLYRTGDKTELMKERINSSYTGGVFEGGLHGGNRVRAAMEGAMRENIRVGVERLGSLEFAVDQEDLSAAGPET